MEPLHSNVQTGLKFFQGGEFHAAHEAWEEGWKVAAGDERQLLQALVQLAAAFHQWNRGKSSGAATLLGRARGHLGGIPSALLGVEVSELELELGALEEAAARSESVPHSPRLRAFESRHSLQRHRHRPRCPYCGERVPVEADAVGVPEETYVEDCPVCCRPWTVRVTRVAGDVALTLGREDD